MPANHLPYFPLHVDDYLNDPVVQGMAADSEGCYISLLVRAWRLPRPGVVPVHLVAELARLHRVPEGRRQEVLDQLALAFDVESMPGFWVQKRMVLEFEVALALHEGRHRGAVSTNRIRWGVAQRSLGESPSDQSASRSAVADRSLRASGVGVDSTDSERLEASEPSTNGKGKAEASRHTRALPPWLPVEVWKDWVAFRKSGRRPFTDRAADLCVLRLEKLLADGFDPRSVVDQSILRGWAGLFPVKAEEGVAAGSSDEDRAQTARIKAIAEGR